MRSHPILAALYQPVTSLWERRALGRLRHSLSSGLEGRVLDLGAGTGWSLPHLEAARRVVALDPDPAMLRRVVPRAVEKVDLVIGNGMRLPFREGSFEAVIVSLVLCTIPGPGEALAEVRRVLAPGGALIFIEHVRLPGWRGRLQALATPLWGRLAAATWTATPSPPCVEQASRPSSSMSTPAAC